MNFLSLFKRNLIYKIKKKDNIDLDIVNKDSLENLFSHYGSDKADILKKINKQGHGFSKFYIQNLNNLKKKRYKNFRNRFLRRCVCSGFRKVF